jgi:hypothetical protein
MTIVGKDGIIASIKRRVVIGKTASRTSVAFIPFSTFDLAGNPGAGTLAVGNTANGIVPTSGIAGYPVIVNPTNKLYIGRINYRWGVAGWVDLYDVVFSAGAYAFNADVTLASQPSFASRLQFDGMAAPDYNSLELWYEAVTAFTGNPSFQINYLDQGGSAGDTGVIATGAALTVGRMGMLPLAAGDSGIQQITRVRCTVATVGTFNVHVMRWLWGGRVNAAGGGGTETLLKSGFSQIFGGSALRVIPTADSTSTGTPAVRLETNEG